MSSKLKRPSQRQIARIVGVSQFAVSKALRGEPDLGKDTRKRILEVAEELGYRPNRLMSNIFSGRTKILGAFMQTMFIPYFQNILYGLEREAFDNDYGLIPIQAVAESDTDEYEINLLLGNQVDGLIVCPRCVDRDQRLYSELLRKGEKIVFVDQNVSIPGACSVFSDDINGSYLAIEFLYKQGHRAIAYVGCNLNNSSTVRFRQQGYRDALKQVGIKPRKKWFLIQNETLEDSILSLLQRSPEITAFFCETDFYALKIVKILENAGKRVPDDVSVVGYGDTIEQADYMKVPLTTVSQGGESIGRTAIQLLLRMLNEGENISGDFIQPVKLVIRDSVRSLKKKK